MNKFLPMLCAGIAALVLAACDEIPENGPKAYAGKQDAPLDSGAPFNGDRDAFEKALAARARKQNEYDRINGAKAS